MTNPECAPGKAGGLSKCKAQILCTKDLLTNRIFSKQILPWNFLDGAFNRFMYGNSLFKN